MTPQIQIQPVQSSNIRKTHQIILHRPPGCTSLPFPALLPPRSIRQLPCVVFAFALLRFMCFLFLVAVGAGEVVLVVVVVVVLLLSCC